MERGWGRETEGVRELRWVLTKGGGGVQGQAETGGRQGWLEGGSVWGVGGTIKPSQKVLVCGGREPCDIVNHFETDLKTIHPAGITCIFLRLL